MASRRFRRGRAWRLARRSCGNLPDLRALAPEEHRALFFTQLFVGVELAPRLRDLSAIIERWTPDVIVHEVAEPAAPIAATAAGLPYVTSGFGPLLSPAIAAQVGRAAAPHWRAAGLAPHPRGGLYEHLYFDPCPPALQLAAIRDVPAVPLRVTPLPTAPLRRCASNDGLCHLRHPVEP